MRTTFISEIGAPDASNTSFRFISSARENPTGGAGRSADPPPQTRAITISPLERPDMIAFSRFAAARPALSGTG
ncbi:hypothetical protein D3C80_2090230 [compost metagenome]